jgi:hypothetical protein
MASFAASSVQFRPTGTETAWFEKTKWTRKTQIRMTVHWSRVAKMLLRLAALGIFTFALLFAVGACYSTAHGYMTWWISSSGKVAVDKIWRHCYAVTPGC